MPVSEFQAAKGYIAAMFTNPDYDNHEHVVFHRDPVTGLTTIIALHSTVLGPAFGGCRMWPYGDEGQALTDALRLARGMTYKAAICGLPYGGGKSVIIGDPKTDKTPFLLRAMGRLVEGLGGRYIIADDVGTSLDDLAVMRQETSHTAAATAAAQQPLGVTAYGVLMAIEAAVGARHVRTDFNGSTFAVQGLGSVGMALCKLLHGRGAGLVVTDIDVNLVAAAKQDFGAAAVAPDEIYDQAVDLFAPCALGAILNDQTIPRLKTAIVCGGANNQLAEGRHDQALAARGITYVPDYLANAGGVIDFYQESIDDRPPAILASVERIGAIAESVLAAARASGETALEVADGMVQARLDRRS